MTKLRILGVLIVAFSVGFVGFVWWRLGQPWSATEALTRLGLIDTVLLAPLTLVLLLFGAHLIVAPHRWRRNRQRR